MAVKKEKKSLMCCYIDSVITKLYKNHYMYPGHLPHDRTRLVKNNTNARSL